VAEAQPTISTHVLDTGSGAPRAGATVRLWRRDAGGARRLVHEAMTDADGRIPDLLDGEVLADGLYALEFVLGGGAFFEGLTVELRVADATRSYHVPLLVAPYGLTTYRGS